VITNQTKKIMSYELGNSYPYLCGWNNYFPTNYNMEFVLQKPYQAIRDNIDLDFIMNCKNAVASIKLLTFMMMFEKVIPISLTTLCLCGVYCCKGFNRYPTLLRIDYELFVEQVKKPIVYTLTYLDELIVFAEKLIRASKEWLQHLNFSL
jgi:hypothetical protein